MNLDDLIKLAEGDLAQFLATKVVAGIVASLPWLGFLSGPLGWVVGILIALFIKYGDWGVYFLSDSLKNTAEGKAYEDAGLALERLPTTATKGEIDAAKKAKRDAFDALFGSS